MIRSGSNKTRAGGGTDAVSAWDVLNVCLDKLVGYSDTLCFPIFIVVFLDSDYAVILVDSPSDDDNILTKEAMDAIWELHSVVLEIEVSTVI